MVRYPKPLQAGDTIAVTAPSAGCEPRHQGRLDFALKWLRDKGFEVIEGNCLRGGTQVSAPVAERAAELNAFLTDASISAVVPPWGGETSIDLIDLLDYDAIRAAEPTWLVGFSDTSTQLLALTLRTGLATLHGHNLMDTPYDLPQGLAPWWVAAATTAGGTFTQHAATHRRPPGFDDWEKDPTPTTMLLNVPTSWKVLHGPSSLEISGRLIGGCVEVLSPLAGTAYGDVRAFGQQHASDGLLVYLEVCEQGAYDVARALHGMRLAGWFDNANAVLLGRTSARDAQYMSQHDAAIDALARLDIPIIADMDFGHVPPYMSFVNGGLATVTVDAGRRKISQTLR